MQAVVALAAGVAALAAVAAALVVVRAQWIRIGRAGTLIRSDSNSENRHWGAMQDIHAAPASMVHWARICRSRSGRCANRRSKRRIADRGFVPGRILLPALALAGALLDELAGTVRGLTQSPRDTGIRRF